MRENNKYWIIYFTRFIGEFIFYSLLTKYLSDSGFDGTEVGMLLSFSPLILAISLPFWVMIDKGKTRKILIITASTLLIVLEYLITYSTTLTALTALMVVYSVIRAPLTPSLDSMTTVFCAETKREFSTIRTFGSIGYIVAILAGSYLYGKVNFVWLVVISTVFFTAFITTSLFIKPLEIDSDKEKNHDYKLLFKNKDFIVFLIVQALCFSALNLNNSYDILYLGYRGMNTALFGVTTLIRVTFEMLAFAFLRKRKFTFKYLYIIMPVLMISQSLIYFFEAPVFTLFLVVMFAGFASGIILFLNNKYIERIVRPRNMTIATYTMVIVQNLFTALYLFLGGMIIKYLGIKFIYLVTAVIFAVSIAFIALLFKTNPAPKEN